MMVLKITFSFLLMIQYAFGMEIKVPAFMSGAKSDPKALKGNFYVYDVKGKFEPQKIIPKKTTNGSVEELLNSLYYSYANNDRDFFFTLFSPEADKKLKLLPKNEFEIIWKIFASRKDDRLEFYHSHKNGFLIGIKTPNEKKIDIQFARKTGKSWQFDSIVLDDNDIATHNIGMWFTFSPMKASKASLIKSFTRKDQFKILEAQVTEPYLVILVKGKDRWDLLGQIKDNEGDFSSWPDLNKAPGIIKIEVNNFEPEEQQKPEFLVIESSYPMVYYPFSLEADGQFSY